jgi:DNA-binding NarL/FixJ family response regulator
MAKPLRIVVADPHPLFRRGAMSVLEGSGMKVVATAEGVAEAIDAAVALRPDVVLMGVELRDGSGITATRRLLDALGEDTKVVLVAQSTDLDLVKAGVRAGAVGYLTKDQAPERMAATVKGVANGEAAFSRRLVAQLLSEVRAGSGRVALVAPGGQRERLTPRQLEILRLIAAGHTTAQIAAELYLSPETVRWHVKAILRKLNARTRAEAAASLHLVATA